MTNVNTYTQRDDWNNHEKLRLKIWKYISITEQRPLGKYIIIVEVARAASWSTWKIFRKEFLPLS